MPDYLENEMDHSARKMSSAVGNSAWGTMLSLSLTLTLVLGLAIAPNSAFAGQQFPLGPDLQMTPGSLCNRGSTTRYPERIRYCARHVDPQLKNQIIRDYDMELGYNVRQMARRKFKIDHFIPLCAGGSNNVDNLWPQHESVYEITDPLEPAVCEKMAAGRLLQVDAIILVRQAKTDLSKAREILSYIESL